MEKGRKKNKKVEKSRKNKNNKKVNSNVYKSVKIEARVYKKLIDYIQQRGLKINFVISRAVEDYLRRVK